MLKNKRIDPRDPETIEWGELISETKTCAEFEELPGRYGIRTSQIFNDAEIDVFVGEYETSLDRITSGNPSETEFYASGGMAYIIVNAAHVGQDIRADYYPGGSVLTAEVLDSEDFKGPQGDTGPQGPTGPTGPAGDVASIENVGTGAGIFKEIASAVAKFKTLVAGANINFDTSDPDEIEISADTSGDVTGDAINAATEKTAPVAADRIPLTNSAASYVLGWASVENLMKVFFPVGAFLQFAGSSAPTGYLACDGAAVSRATYAALFGVIGTTYGVGDGSTTFGLPDARGLVMVGAGAHGTMTRANGTAYNGGAVGASRDDQMIGHVHVTDTANAGTGTTKIGNGATDNADINTGAAVSDGTNGTPRTGDETRPAEIAVLVCIKF
jgi:microcystin-dependent protein